MKNTKWIFTFLCMLILTTCSLSAHSWDSHFLMTYLALKEMPEMKRQAMVPAESLASFVIAERDGLLNILLKNENWAREHINAYSGMPRELFNQFAQASNEHLALQFLMTIRVNPSLAYSLYVQYPPNEKHRVQGGAVARAQIMLPTINHVGQNFLNETQFEKVAVGEWLTPIEIIATAAEEPDYGMDINLWQNNRSWFGKRYGFGKQPFGNRHVDFSSQAPFHLGFYHEAPLLYQLAPSLKKCLPVYRIHLYFSLSEFAFKTGHPYWGYRFLGWGLHYIQDLTQPYHATLAPNISLVKLITANTVAAMGFSKYKDNIIQLISNRHFSLESYQSTYLLAMLKAGDVSAPIIQALQAVDRDKRYPSYRDDYAVNVVAKEVSLNAPFIDSLIRKAFPKRFVSDATYLFYITEPEVNLYELAQTHPNRHLQQLNAALLDLLVAFGAHTRNVVRYYLPSN